MSIKDEDGESSEYDESDDDIDEGQEDKFPTRPTHVDTIPPVGNSQPPPRKVLSQANKESMYLGSCLLSAVRTGEDAEVATWLKAGRSMGIAVAMDVKTGKSTLHYAAESGRLGICKMLVDAGAVQTSMDKYGKTPLHLAVINGHLAVVQFLLSNIVPQMFHVPSKATLVHEAVRRGRVTILNALLRAGFSANETNGEGETALHIVARYGNLELAKLLVLRRANVHAVTRTLGQTPLHYTCIYGNTEVACFLVRRGADAHLPDLSQARKSAVDKCEDCAHRATLNAVLRSAKEYRDLVSDLDEADRRAHAYELSRIEAFTKREGAARAKLAKQVVEEASLVEKHAAVERMLNPLKGTVRTLQAVSAPPSAGCAGAAGGGGGTSRVKERNKSGGGRSYSDGGRYRSRSDEKQKGRDLGSLGGLLPKKKVMLGMDRVESLLDGGRRSFSTDRVRSDRVRSGSSRVKSGSTGSSGNSRSSSSGTSFGASFDFGEGDEESDSVELDSNGSPRRPSVDATWGDEDLRTSLAGQDEKSRPHVQRNSSSAQEADAEGAGNTADDQQELRFPPIPGAAVSSSPAVMLTRTRTMQGSSRFGAALFGVAPPR